MIEQNPNISDADEQRRLGVVAVTAMTDILINAALDFAQAWSISQSFESIVITCDELDTLHVLLTAAGYVDAADKALRCHQQYDEPGDGHYVGSGA